MRPCLLLCTTVNKTHVAFPFFKFKTRRRSNKMHQHEILTSHQEKGPANIHGLSERNVIHCSEIYSYRKKLVIARLVMWNPNRGGAKNHFRVVTYSLNESFFLSKSCSSKPEVRVWIIMHTQMFRVRHSNEAWIQFTGSQKRNQNMYNISIHVYFTGYWSHAVFWPPVCPKLSPPVDDDSREALSEQPCW